MTAAEREARILSLEPLVKIIAKKRIATLPIFARLEDLVSAGWLGAIYAVDRFDPARHVELGAFATFRIRGAIEDYLRHIDHLSRDHRAAVKLGTEESPVVFSIDQRIDLHSHCSSWDLISAHDSIGDDHAEAEQRRRDARLTLRSIFARAHLRPRSARMLRRWMEGDKLKALAEEYGINESRASQICSQAIQKLRAAA